SYSANNGRGLGNTSYHSTSSLSSSSEALLYGSFSAKSRNTPSSGRYARASCEGRKRCSSAREDDSEI
ncbi:MAG: hypothetical protein WCI84_07745, partial [Bacteroidota bacterium]